MLPPRVYLSRHAHFSAVALSASNTIVISYYFSILMTYFIYQASPLILIEAHDFIFPLQNTGQSSRSSRHRNVSRPLLPLTGDRPCAVLARSASPRPLSLCRQYWYRRQQQRRAAIFPIARRGACAFHYAGFTSAAASNNTTFFQALFKASTRADDIDSFILIIAGSARP